MVLFNSDESGSSLRPCFPKGSLLRALATFGAFMALHAAPCMAQESAPATTTVDWISRFENEYPSAADRLVSNMRDVVCEGEFAAPLLIRFEPSIRFRVLTRDDQVRWHRKTANAGESVDVINTTEFFSLIGEKGGKYYLQDRLEHPTERMKNQFNLFCWRFLRATTYLWDQRPLLEAFRSGDLRLVSATGHAEHVIFGFEYLQPAPNPSQNSDRKTGRGTITLSPDQDWAIRECTYDVPYVKPLRLRMTIGVQDLDGVGIVPSSYDYVSEVKRSEANGWEHMEEYSCRFEKIAKQSLPDSEFVLETFGIDSSAAESQPGGARRRISPLLLANLGCFTVIGLVLLYRKSRNRKPLGAEGISLGSSQ